MPWYDFRSFTGRNNQKNDHWQDSDTAALWQKQQCHTTCAEVEPCKLRFAMQPAAEMKHPSQPHCRHQAQSALTSAAFSFETKRSLMKLCARSRCNKRTPHQQSWCLVKNQQARSEMTPALLRYAGKEGRSVPAAAAKSWLVAAGGGNNLQLFLIFVVGCKDTRICAL